MIKNLLSIFKKNNKKVLISLYGVAVPISEIDYDQTSLFDNLKDRTNAFKLLVNENMLYVGYLTENLRNRGLEQFGGYFSGVKAVDNIELFVPASVKKIADSIIAKEEGE